MQVGGADEYDDGYGSLVVLRSKLQLTGVGFDDERQLNESSSQASKIDTWDRRCVESGVVKKCPQMWFGGDEMHESGLRRGEE